MRLQVSVEVARRTALLYRAADKDAKKQVRAQAADDLPWMRTVVMQHAAAQPHYSRVWEHLVKSLRVGVADGGPVLRAGATGTLRRGAPTADGRRRRRRRTPGRLKDIASSYEFGGDRKKRPQLPPRRRAGWAVWPAAAEITPRLIGRWTAALTAPYRDG